MTLNRQQLKILGIARRHQAAIRKVVRLHDQLAEAKKAAQHISSEFDVAVHADNAGDVRFSYRPSGIVVTSVDGTTVS